MPRKVGDAVRAFLEPFVVPAVRATREKRQISPAPCSEKMHVPLGDDNTAFSSLDAAPHAPALLKVFSPSVDGVQSGRLGLAPVGD